MTAERSKAGGGGILYTSIGRSEWLLAGLVFAAALGYFGATLHRTIDLRDEGYLLYDIEQTARGAVAHRDFVALYGPGVYALNAALFRTFGVEILPLRWSIAAIRAAAVALAYLIARHVAPRPFALLAAVLAAGFWGRVIWNLNAPYAAVYTIPLCMLATLLLLRALAAGGSLLRFAWVGVASGAAIAFKQSLGSVAVFGTALAICAASALESGRDAPPTALRRALVAAWLAVGAIFVVPFLGLMTPVDYALHFLPIHLLLILVALRFARGGAPEILARRALPRLTAFGLGALVLPGVVALLYLFWGALGKLLYQMFVFPRELQNYYDPIDPPPLAGAAVVIALFAAPTAGMLGLRGRRAAALAWLALALACIAAAYLTRSSALFIAVVSLPQVNGSLPALISGLVLVLLARQLARGDPDEGPTAATLVVVLMFQLMMGFQIFPRGAYNLTMMMGTLAPLTAYLLYRWSAAALPATGAAPARGRFARAAPVALAAVLPIGVAAPMFLDGAGHIFGRRPFPTGMHFPATAGLEIKPSEYVDQQIRAAEWLIDHIQESRPDGAPLFVLTNEFMIPFLADRDDLFPEYSYYRHLIGWNMLPPETARRMDVPGMLARLSREPDPIVIDSDDFAAQNLRRALPELAAYIDADFFVEYRIGRYRVLRKRTGAAGAGRTP